MGAGALGSFLGAALATAGHEVTLVTRRADHASAVNANGLRVSGKSEFVARPSTALRARDVPVPDLLLLTVKAYDTARAIADAEPILGQRTRVLSVQNGLGNHERLLDALPATRILLGVTTHGVTYVEPGHVRHAGTGYFRVGSPAGDTKAAGEIAGLLTQAGIATEPSDAILGEVWAKVVVNAGINPITAVTGLPNGAILELAFLRELMERACEEAIDVARAEGVALPDDDLILRTRRVAELTAQNRSSMLQDIERGRRTEIDAIAGEIVERGLKLGVDTPVNLTLRALVKGIEATTTR